MRSVSKTSNIRFLRQVAALAVVAIGAAGCSGDVTRFDNLFGPTENRSQIVTASVQPTQANPTTPVTTGALPPQAASAPLNRQALPPPATPVASAPPAWQTGARSSGWSAAGGTAITVTAGETVDTLSRRYGVPANAIASANNMAPGAQLTPGQQLIIPTYSYGAPQAVAAAQTASGAVPTTAAGGIYVVQPGDNLGRIANSYGMRSTELAAANGISSTAPIRIGQKLRIPGPGAANTQVAALNTGANTDAMPARLPAPAPQPLDSLPGTAAGQPMAGTAPAASPLPGQAQAQKQVQNPGQTQVAAVQPATPQMAQGAGVQSSVSGSFRWPVRGRVISTYGVRPNGERNDGINIEVPEGTPIKAAEGGTVIYAGNELKGYGNLVLIKHPNGFVSAYAHASEILVKRDDMVMRGQTIGKVGATGNVTRPQLHFEIRQGNRPIDPLPHLS